MREPNEKQQIASEKRSGEGKSISKKQKWK